MKKRLIDALFILCIAVLLMIGVQYDVFENYLGFILIPFLITYQIGQWVERKYGSGRNE
ncbi:MAG: hypothetical protein RQ756_03215 [Flavobacteriaceae bacterium]|nr:hypothetical protein [Flavobacteriaceae bacterium]